MAEPITGGCLCGAVRYRCAADPIMGAHCQCNDCRRSSGTGHCSHMVLPKEAFSISGELRFYARPADSGNKVQRGFCPTCGAPVYSTNDGMPDFVFVRAGSLDDPARFVPVMVVYASRGPVWDHLDPALPKVPEMPPAEMMAEL